MTDEAVAFIEPRRGDGQAWAEIYAAMAGAGLLVPRDWNALMGLWNRRLAGFCNGPTVKPAAYKRRAQAADVPPKKCLRCRKSFRPEHKYNFLCAGCKA